MATAQWLCIVPRTPPLLIMPAWNADSYTSLRGSYEDSLLRLIYKAAPLHSPPVRYLLRILIIMLGWMINYYLWMFVTCWAGYLDISYITIHICSTYGPDRVYLISRRFWPLIGLHSNLNLPPKWKDSSRLDRDLDKGPHERWLYHVLVHLCQWNFSMIYTSYFLSFCRRSRTYTHVQIWVQGSFA